jgi:hypothetical protein
MAISKKQWLGVARQAIAGTSQPSPTLFLPAKATFKNMKKRIYFSEDRNTRDENNQVVDGSRMWMALAMSRPPPHLAAPQQQAQPAHSQSHPLLRRVARSASTST